jgi:hypothetical protein
MKRRIALDIQTWSKPMESSEGAPVCLTERCRSAWQENWQSFLHLCARTFRILEEGLFGRRICSFFIALCSTAFKLISEKSCTTNQIAFEQRPNCFLLIQKDAGCCRFLLSRA